MSDQVNYFGGGLTLNSWDRKPLISCLQKLPFDFEELKTQAKLSRVVSRMTNDPEQIFKTLVSDIQKIRKKKALIFFPWAASQVYSSGAGKAVISQEIKLVEQGYEVEIICVGLSTIKKTKLGNPIDGIRLNQRSYSGNLHIDYHESDIHPDDQERVKKKIAGSDKILFEGTHLVLPISKLEIDRLRTKVDVVSHDLLSVPHDKELDKRLQALQVQALRLGEAFALNSGEVRKWNELGIKCGLRSEILTGTVANAPSSYKKQFLNRLLGNIDENAQIVFFVGTNYPPNIKALEKIRELSTHSFRNKLNVIFVVAGTVSFRYRADNLICLGKVSEFTLKVLYEFSDVFFCPLEEGTGVSIKILEALSQKIPVLSTEVGFRGISPELVNENCKTISSLENIHSIVEQLNSFPKRQDADTFEDYTRHENIAGSSLNILTNNLEVLIALLDLDNKKDVLDVVRYHENPVTIIADRVLLTFINWVFNQDHKQIYSDDYLKDNLEEIFGSSEQERKSRSSISGYWIYDVLEHVRNFIPSELHEKYYEFMCSHKIASEQEKPNRIFLNQFSNSLYQATIIDVVKKVIPKKILHSAGKSIGIEKQLSLIRILYWEIRPKFVVRFLLWLSKKISTIK